MVTALHKMDRILFSGKAQLMADYKANCITLGKEIQVIKGDEIRPGKADYTGRLCVIGAELKQDALAELFGL